jgi:hypothetical protein
MMLILKLTWFAACIVSLAGAQPLQPELGVHNITLEAEACGRFRLGIEGEPERASYRVETFPQLIVRTLPLSHTRSNLNLCIL